jgi:peptide/nickel transport system substrate-binding protein
MDSPVTRRVSLNSTIRNLLQSGRYTRRGVLQRAAVVGLGVGSVTTLPRSAFVAAAQDEPSEWIYGLPQEANTLDPNSGDSSSPANAPPLNLLLNDLVQFVALRDGPEFTMDYELAESHEVISDTVWEFKLREGVKFHNGDDFTVDDVDYSYGLFAQPESPLSYIGEMIERVEVVDPFTVRFHTKGIQVDFLATGAVLPILPRSYREEVGPEGFNDHPVGTGPYSFVEAVRGERIVVDAFADYWGGMPSPDRIVLRPIPDPTTRVAELRAGGVDIIQAPPLPLLADIQNDPNTELVELVGARTIQYRINAAKAPFDDVRVRQAVNYAVDRDVIIGEVLEGHGTPFIGTFSEGWLGWDPELEPYPYDPEMARQLLAEAGHADGFETDFNTTSGVYLNDIQVAEAVAAYLAEVGITLHIITAEPTKLLDDYVAGNWQGFLISPWGKESGVDFMLRYTHYNHPAYPDEQLNKLVDKGSQTIDPAEREAALQELTRYVHEQAYNLEIHSQSEFWAKRAEIDWEPWPVSSFSDVLLYRPAAS